MKHSNANGRSENPLHQEKPSPPLIRSNNSAMRQQSPTARSSDGFDPIKTYLKQLKRERKNGKGEYLISVGDLLDMTVRDAEELNEKMRVDEDGNVKLQFELGTVHAAGLSCSELTAKIKQVLVEKDYVRDPQVDIFVEEYGSLSIAVLGAVAKPGVYYLAERTIKFADVFDAAGGVVDEETSGQVYLYRQGEIDSSEAEDSNAARSGLGGYVKEPSRIKFDLSAILLGLEPSSSFPIKGGDVIVVGVMGRPIGGTDDAGRFFFIMGEVNEPGVFELARDTTVLQAITIAGGLTNVAKPSEIRVVRPVDNKALKLDLSKVAKGDQEDIWLEPEDIIIVPKNGSKAFALGFVDFWRSVFGVGVGIDYDANIGWNPSKRRLKAGTRR